MRKLIFLAVSVLGVAVLLTALKRCSSGGSTPRYQTAPLVRSSIRETIYATGRVNPATLVEVGTQVSGTIRELLVDFNDPVKKDQVIARLDPALFEAQVAQAEAALVSARARRDRAQVEHENSRRALLRSEKLSVKGYLSKSDRENAEAAARSAEAALHAAEADVSQAEASVRVARTNLEHSVIRSPIDGVVISRDVNVGQTVAASFQAPKLFTLANDLSKIRVEAQIVETDIGKVKTGLKAAFTVDAYPGRGFTGVVIQVRNSPKDEHGLVSYEAVIEADNSEGLLKPGMSAMVTIIAAEAPDTLAVPPAALRFKPSRPSGEKTPAGPTIYRLENGAAVPISVKAGISDGKVVAVASPGGLNAGDLVIVAEVAPEERPRSSWADSWKEWVSRLTKRK